MNDRSRRTIVRILATLCLVAAAGCSSCNDDGDGDGASRDTGPADARTDTGEDMGADAAPSEDGGTDMGDDMSAADMATDIGEVDATPDMADMEPGEVCDNGDDDDGDGDVDCRDDDCDASPACRASSVTIGWGHGCAVFENGTVRCWGDGSTGALGDDTMDDQPRPPVLVEGIDDATDVVAGHHFSCALHADQTVSCWGANDRGQLGDASFIDSPVPATVSGLDDAVALAAGESNACAVRAGGTVVCWGSNEEGQLGGGSSETAENEPIEVQFFALVDVVPLDNAVDVDCQGEHCCALRDDATAACWGRNDLGMLSGGSSADSHDVAIAVARQTNPLRLLNDVADLGVGFVYSCFSRTDGSVWCGGLAPGLPATSEVPRVAVELNLFSDAEELWGGAGYVCALRTSGRVICWGMNGKYQCGDPDGGNSDGYQLPGLQDPIDFSAGNESTCYVDGDGKVFCFGLNDTQQLGSETMQEAVAQPQRVMP